MKSDACVPDACADGGVDEVTECDAGLLDLATNLCWQEPPDSSPKLRNDAFGYCETLVWDGFTDWRLPTISELRSLLRGCASTETGGACGVTDECAGDGCWDEAACAGCMGLEGPGVDGCYWDPELTGACSYYWSSSGYEGYLSYNWIVGFSFGSVYFADDTNYYVARCVRGEP